MSEARRKADETIFAPIRDRLGFDQVKIWAVGAAPTPVEVMEFFFALGCPLGEVWGMSELSALATMNPIPIQWSTRGFAI